MAKSLERSEQLNIVKIDGMQNHAVMYRESLEELRKGAEMNMRVGLERAKGELGKGRGWYFRKESLIVFLVSLRRK